MAKVGRRRRNLVIFITTVLAVSFIAGLVELIRMPREAGPGQLICIITPLLVMILLRSFAGDGWDDFGLKPNFSGNGFWWLASLLIFPVVMLVSVLAGITLGGLDFDSSRFNIFIPALLAGLIPSLIKNVFEEFAWRGYLAPKIYALERNIWASHTAVGIVWGLWHLPFVFVFWTYMKPDMLWYFFPILLIGTISQSIVYGEIRLATNSVMPALIMHTIGNALGGALMLSQLISLKRGEEILFSPGAEGIVSIILMFAAGYWLHRRRTASESSA